MDEATLMASRPSLSPIARLIWTAIVDVGPRENLGAGPLGHRFIVPILGGRFVGGRGNEGLSGAVLQGGADRQLLRSDGVKELDAMYEMRTVDGVTLGIRNRVVVDDTRQPERYALSRIHVEAPAGVLDWLNRRLPLGTLQSAKPEREAVIIRAWIMDADAKPKARKNRSQS